MGFEVRARVCPKASTVPSTPERPMAPRRDGRSHRRKADVPVARRRSRGRGSRYAGSAPPRQARGTPADAQAAQETRLRAEIADDRQAGVLRIRFSASSPDLASRAGVTGEQSRREFPSNRATTRAKNAEVQVRWLCPALSERARRSL